MTTEQWNRRHPVGTRIRVTLPGGEAWQTRTVEPAVKKGGLDYVGIAGLNSLVPLSAIDVLADVLPWFPAARPDTQMPAAETRASGLPWNGAETLRRNG